MRLVLDPSNARPLWRQLEDQLRLHIGSGALAEGAPVPSVRDLARELVVNPATISKAYRRLTDDGLLEVRRGQGTFVAVGAPRLGATEQAEELAQAADRYAVTARTLRVPLRQAEEQLQESWDDLSPDDATRVGKEAGK